MDGYLFLLLADGAWIFGGVWIAYENGIKHFERKNRVNKAGISSICLGIIMLVEAIILIIWSFYLISSISDCSQFLVIPIGMVIGGIICIYLGKKFYEIHHIYSDKIDDIDQ